MTDETVVSLYQRYRPLNFRQLVGQEEVRDSLRQSVADSTVSHAYLFVGERGCGKTSAAKILSRAVNCENLDNGEPCNVCDSCQEIMAGQSLSVLEYDAGSNSGINDMKENILNPVNQVVPGKRKVIIIDEAHLLSDSAISALLMTLETPPPNVTFILCSTELRKIKKTIVSRCQQRKFLLLSVEDMTWWLTKVSSHAKLQITEEDIKQAVRDGQGSARDAISALEAIASGVSFTKGGAYKILEAMSTKDTLAVLTAATESIRDGEAPRDIAESLFVLLRECFFINMNVKELLTTPDWENRDTIAQTLGAKNITTAIQQVGEAINGIQSGGDPRVNLEIALARYCALAK